MSLEYGWLLAVGNLVLSFIGGGIAGAMITHYLQTRGEIRPLASRWESHNSGDQCVVYRFHLFFYNETATLDGLWNCRVVFSKDGKELVSSRPKRENREGMWKFIHESAALPYRPPLEVIELPPKTPVHIEVRGSIEDNEIKKARQSTRVEFVARSPVKGELRAEVPTGYPVFPPLPGSKSSVE